MVSDGIATLGPGHMLKSLLAAAVFSCCVCTRVSGGTACVFIDVPAKGPRPADDDGGGWV